MLLRVSLLFIIIVSLQCGMHVCVCVCMSVQPLCNIYFDVMEERSFIQKRKEARKKKTEKTNFALIAVSRYNEIVY